MKIKENKGRNGKINNSNNTKMGLGCTPRTQYQPIAGKVWCTASHVLNAPAATLAKLVRPWTIVFVNTAGL